ncbi:hypothetical protein BH09PSE2_BH09PSE2_04920 [soil metagenome]
MINVVREGRGRPLLLVHGIGGSWRSWSPILAALADHREVIAIDLPCHCASPAEADSGTFAGLAASLERFILAEGMENVPAVGSSMGARLVLEMGRRGKVGPVVALDPGGFWRGWERRFFGATIGASIKLVRALAPALPAICGTAVGRTALLAQLSVKPWALSPDLVAGELKSFAATRTFDALVHDLATGPEQIGPAAPTSGPVTIGWGPAGPTLPAVAVQARAGRLSGRQNALVRAQRAFPSLGSAGGDRPAHPRRGPVSSTQWRQLRSPPSSIAASLGAGSFERRG